MLLKLFKGDFQCTGILLGSQIFHFYACMVLKFGIIFSRFLSYKECM